ncbi:hypothetical protein COU54_04010 [Candidatus Pacearchaeota archaeon CG10_big_fil_rev_8_21_14_0_10_31_24]|nr:MAG: hypothetical protein COU54_04010 [Candidatus Pacearchaeota archaeon CG10_big_fil_rev_8_21_14_0_10_31_24]
MNRIRLERIIELNAPELHEFIKNRKETFLERAEIVEESLKILGENNYKDYSVTWGEEDWNGNTLFYPVRYTFGFDDLIPDCNFRFHTLPVRIEDSSDNDVCVELVLIDRIKRKVHKIYDSGNKGIHYYGKISVKPLELRYLENRDIVQVAYQLTRIPSLKENTGEKFYEMVARLFKTGTTAEKEYSIANVEIEK